MSSREKQREYLQNWRKNHPDKVKEYEKRSRSKKERQEYLQEYKETHKEELKKYHVKYYEEHAYGTLSDEEKEHVREVRKANYLKNKERIMKRLHERREKEKIENLASVEYATQHRKRWCEKEEEILVEMVFQGESIKDIAYTLRRSIRSVENKIIRLKKDGVIVE
jgi:hypothetical protein